MLCLCAYLILVNIRLAMYHFIYTKQSANDDDDDDVDESDNVNDVVTYFTWEFFSQLCSMLFIDK